MARRLDRLSLTLWPSSLPLLWLVALPSFAALNLTFPPPVSRKTAILALLSVHSAVLTPLTKLLAWVLAVSRTRLLLFEYTLRLSRPQLCYQAWMQPVLDWTHLNPKMAEYVFRLIHGAVHH